MLLYALVFHYILLFCDLLLLVYNLVRFSFGAVTGKDAMNIYFLKWFLRTYAYAPLEKLPRCGITGYKEVVNLNLLPVS